MHGLVLAGALLGWLLPIACMAEQRPVFNPDTDPSRIRWTDLAKALGPAPNVRGQRFGVVLKTPTNEYFRLMTAGIRRRAAADGVKLDIQSARDESDQARQLAVLQTMVGNRYKALLISPIAISNLQPAIDDAAAAKVPLVNVDGAVSDSLRHFVGPNHRDMGVLVANWFIRNYPAGGKVAVVEGQAGLFGTLQRTAGFRETLAAKTLAAKPIFEVAASAPADWDRQLAFDATKAILAKAPDIIGIYCNNDTMALGAVDAVKAMGVLERIRVFGSDGTGVTYESIAAGEMTGTVDIFPAMIGEVGLEVAERLSVGQAVPRVVQTPQVLITRENVARYRVSEELRRKHVIEDEERDPAPARR